MFTSMEPRLGGRGVLNASGRESFGSAQTETRDDRNSRRLPHVDLVAALLVSTSRCVGRRMLSSEGLIERTRLELHQLQGTAIGYSRTPGHFSRVNVRPCPHR